MKYLKLFESFDRYQFGIYYDNIAGRFADLKGEFIPFKLDEAEIILKIIEDNEDVEIDDENTGDGFYLHINDVNEVDEVFGEEYMECINLHYLGDYCYAVFISRMSGNRDRWFSCEIFDEFPALQEYLKNLNRE